MRLFPFLKHSPDPVRTCILHHFISIEACTTVWSQHVHRYHCTIATTHIYLYLAASSRTSCYDIPLPENNVAYTTKENCTSSPDLIQLSDSDCNTSQVRSTLGLCVRSDAYKMGETSLSIQKELLHTGRCNMVLETYFPSKSNLAFTGNLIW